MTPQHLRRRRPSREHGNALPARHERRRHEPAPVSAPTDTDAWFIVGQTVYGVTGDYRLLRSLSDFTTLYGPRLATSVMYDCVETFFRDGGAR